MGNKCSLDLFGIPLFPFYPQLLENLKPDIKPKLLLENQKKKKKYFGKSRNRVDLL